MEEIQLSNSIGYAIVAAIWMAAAVAMWLINKKRDK